MVDDDRPGAVSLCGRMRREIYLDRHFLDATACRRIRAAMDRGEAEPAEVLRGGLALDAAVRSASYIEVDAEIRASVESRLDAVRTTLAEWLSMPLEAREGAGFVRYPPGGFYRPHRDRGVDPEWDGARQRRIAVVVFLNSSRERPQDDEFSGGILRLLGDRAVDVVPARGSLVAFRAEALHEVTPVIAGARDVVVDWFY